MTEKTLIKIDGNYAIYNTKYENGHFVENQMCTLTDWKAYEIKRKLYDLGTDMKLVEELCGIYYQMAREDWGGEW